MQKGNLLRINLLPAEFLYIQREYQKFHQVQWICIIIILLLIFLASLTVGLRVFQAQKVSSAEFQLAEFTNKVSSFKDREAQLLVLKNRLTTIGRLTDSPSKQRQMYNLINELLPTDVIVSSVSVDGTGNVTLSLVTRDVGVLQATLDSLLSPERNEGLVSKIQLDNLTMSRDGLLRVNIKIISV